MKLNRTAYGEGPPFVIAHGLFGSGRNWTSFAKAAADWRAITVDLRNHGDSPWDAAMDYPAMGNDLLELIAGAEDGPAVLLGHSMGGKASMAAALIRPDAIAALIVVVYGHSHANYIGLLQALDLDKITRRSDADAALAGDIPDPGLRQFLLQNLDFKDTPPRWKPNLAAIDANMQALTDFPFEASEKTYDGPALFIAGSESAYVTPESHDAIRAFFTEAQIEVIEGAGHWVHAEKPEEFGALVKKFLTEQV
mgnify:FL=1